MNSIGILENISESELNIAIKAIQTERRRITREQIFKTANEKLEDLEKFCGEHGIIIATPDFEGCYHPMHENLRGKIKLR